MLKVAAPPVEASSTSYQRALCRTTTCAAIPYGFTLLNACAAGLLIRTHGPPTFAAALLFLAGAVIAFSALAVLGGAPARRSTPEPALDARWLGPCAGVAALAGFAGSAPLAYAISGVFAFGAVSLAATAVYLAGGAFAIALLERRPPGLTARGEAD